MGRYRLTETHEDTMNKEVNTFTNKDDLIDYLMELVYMTSPYFVDLEKV
jgi:hypothetical protein